MHQLALLRSSTIFARVLNSDLAVSVVLSGARMESAVKYYTPTRRRIGTEGTDSDLQHPNLNVVNYLMTSFDQQLHRGENTCSYK
jgi:hypothetical protein